MTQREQLIKALNIVVIAAVCFGVLIGPLWWLLFAYGNSIDTLSGLAEIIFIPISYALLFAPFVLFYAILPSALLVILVPGPKRKGLYVALCAAFAIAAMWILRINRGY